MFDGMFDAVKTAWKLVRSKLSQHGKDTCSPSNFTFIGRHGKLCNSYCECAYLGPLRVPKDILDEELTFKTPLEYLIPTTTGKGICTTSLVHYLVQVHNEFVRRCQSIMASEQGR